MTTFRAAEQLHRWDDLAMVREREAENEQLRTEYVLGDKVQGIDFDR